MSINPKAALDAVLAAPITVAPGVAVHPLTLDLFAKLDAVGCPVFTGAPCRAAEMIPSFYLATHPDAPVEGVADAAAAWARTLPAGLFSPLAKAFGRQVDIAEHVVPSAGEHDGRPKAATAG